MPDTPDQKNRAYIYAFFMSIFGAASAAALKYISHDVAIEFTVFWQFLICLLLCVMIIYHGDKGFRELLNIEKHDRLVLFVRGVAGLLGFYAFYGAIKGVPLVDAILLRHSSPLFVPLLAFLAFRLKTDKVTLLFMLAGFSGVYIALQPDFSSVNMYHLAGLASGAFLATSMVTTNRLKKYSSMTVLFYYFFIGSVGTLPLGLYHWQGVSFWQLILIMFIGSSIFIAMYLYNKAFTLSSAAVVSPMTYLSVIHAGILGYLIWGHVPALISILGMCIVAACGIATSVHGSVPRKP